MRRKNRARVRSPVCVNTRSVGPTLFPYPEEWSIVPVEPRGGTMARAIPAGKRALHMHTKPRFPRANASPRASTREKKVSPRNDAENDHDDRNDDDDDENVDSRAHVYP